jgi:hypothetical protein
MKALRPIVKSPLGRALILLTLAVLAPACGGGGGGGGGVFVTPFGFAIAGLPNATANVAYAATIGAQGGAPPYQWTVISGSLPAGISLDPASGAIAGTAGSNGSFSFVVRLTDSANNSVVRSFTLTVTGGAGGGLAVTTTTLPTGTVGAAYTGALSASGGTPGYSWVITLGSLPTGLNLVGSTGQIVGTPTTASGGAVSVTFKVTDNVGGTATGAVLITINAVPAIATSSLPGGEVGVPYSQALATSGGTTPFTFSVSSGALPGGLALDGSAGSISGSPNANGLFNFTITLTDAAGATASQPLSITVAADPVITTTSLIGAVVGSNYTPPALTATGGTGALTWSVVSGTLPPGTPAFALSAGGQFSGKPTGSNGLYSFTVQVTDADGKSATKDLSISVTGGTVTALSITTTSPLPTGDQGVPYLDSLSATGGTPPYSWVVSGAPPLPAGLGLSASGQISGTPTAATGAPVSVTFKVTDSAAPPLTASLPLAITINSPVTFTTTSLVGADQTYAYNQSVSASGGSGAFTYAVTSGTLPTGLSLNGATGAITGTPTGLGTSNFSITANDTLGGSASKALSIVVNPPVTVTTAVLPAWTINQAGYSATLAASGGSGTYTWTFTGTLPTGLSLSAAGVLSGKPTVANTFGFTVTAKDTLNNQASAGLSVLINPAISVTTLTASPWTQNSPGYTYTLGANGGTGAYTWSGTPPAGLSLSPAGVLSGTPTAAPGTPTFVATATDAVGATGSGTVSITINAVPSITDASPLPNGDPNVAYSKTLTPNGGTGTLTWTISVPALPGGTFALGSATGTIAGTTAASGTSNFTVKVTDATGAFGTKAFALTINPVITVTTASLPTAEQGVVYSGATLAANGGTGTYTWGISTLPAGMVFNTSTGALTGTPTVAPGTTPITFTATDTLNGTGTSSALNFVVKAPVTVTGTTPAWTVGQPYTATVTASSGLAPYTWTPVAGTPAGITTTPAATTYALGGTPTVAGTFPLNFKVTDALGGTFTLGTSLVINPAVGISGTVPTAWNRLTAFPSTTLTATPGTSPFTWTYTGLPNGLNTVPASGGMGATLVISGTPTTKGPNTLSVTVTDAAGSTINQTYPIQINDPLVFTGSLPTFWDLNAAFTPQLGAQGGTAPYTWTVTAPSGLTASPGGVNNATLSFTGSPNALGGSTFNITLKDSAAGSINQAPAITINPALLMNGQGSFPLTIDQSAPYNTTLTASAGTTNYSWSVGGLPPGIIATPSGAPGTTLTFSGSTTAPTGNYPLNIQLTDQGGGSVTFAPTLVVKGTLSISGTFPTAWDQNAAFSQTLNAAGGLGPYTWTYSNVPAGITVAPASGSQGPSLVFSAAPNTSSGTPVAVSITLTDQAGGTANFNPSITINLPLGFTGNVVSPWDQNFNYNQTLSATGGTGTYTWSITGGTLPAGINKNINGANNVNLQLVGAPTGTGSSSFNINLTDQGGGSLVLPNTIFVNAALAMSFPWPSAWDQGVSFNPPVTALGGTTTTPYSWTVTGLPGGIGTAPTGPNLANLNVSGSAGAPGTFPVQVKVTDAIGNSITNNVSFKINPPLSGITTSLPTGTTLSLYGATLQVSNGSPGYNWAISAGALPTGIGFNSSTGAISGNPTAPPGTYPVTFQVTDQGGGTLSTGSMNIVLNGQITLTPSGGAFPAGTVGTPGYSTGNITVSGGIPPYTSINVTGSTPPGLVQTLGATTVSYSGTPTAQGVFSFQVKATDSVGAIAIGNYQIPVNSASTTGPLVLSPASGPLPPGDQNSPYFFQFTGSGGKSSSYQFNVTAGVNPFALGFNTAGTLSGTLSGSPGTSPSFTVTLTDGVNPAVSGNFTLTMNPPLNLSPIVLPVGDANTPYTFQPSASGGTTPITWALLGAVPPGIGISNPSGQISGTTASNGTFQVQVQITDAVGAVQTSGTLALIFNSPPTITTTSIPGGQQGVAYPSTTINAIGGTGSYTWGMTGAPAGITIGPATGTLSGTTTAAATTYPLTITVTDQAGGTGTFKPNLVIAPGTLTISTTTLPGADVGHAYNQTIQFFGGTGPYTWSVSGGSIAPLGLSTSGQITGTPTVAGTISFTAKVVDSTTPTAQSATQLLSILVGQPPTIMTTNLPAGQANQFYSAQINVNGGGAPLTYSQTGGVLPAGITLNTSTGVISGTTSSVGTVAGLQFTVTDSVSVSTNQTYSLTINPQLGNQGNFSIGQIRLPDAIAGSGYTGNVYVTQSNGTHFTYQVVDTGLLPPGGLVMNTQAGTGANNLPNAGILTGTPSQAGEFTFTVMATDGFGNVALGNVLLIVLAPPTSVNPVPVPLLSITTTTLPAGTAGSPYPITQLQAAGGRPPYTWGTTGRNGLPFGMALTQDGFIYGVSAQAGTFTQEYFVSDTSSPPQYVPTSLQMVINPAGAGFKITSGNLGTVTVNGSAIAPITLTTSGGTAPMQWIADTKGMQIVGLTFSPAGTITGTPTITGLINFPMAVVDSSATTQFAGGEGTINVTTAGAIKVTSLAVPPIFSSQAYSFQLTATGGTPGSYVWTAPTPPPNNSDGLPTNVTLSTGGLLQYAPSGSNNNNGNNNNVVIQVTDGANTTQVLINLSMFDANNNNSFSFNFPNLYALGTGTQGQNYSNNLGNAGFGSDQDNDWTLVNAFPNGFTVSPIPPASQGLVPGLTLDPARGVVSGTPSVPGHYTLHVVSQEISANGNNSNNNMSVFATENHALLDIMPQGGGGAFQIVTRILPPGREGVAYGNLSIGDSSILLANGVGGYAFSIANGSLPPGLVLDAANGIVTGTPTQSGTYVCQIQATQNGGAQTALMRYEIPIDPALPFGVFTNRLPNAEKGQPYSAQLQGEGASGAVTWSDAGSATTFASLGLTLSASGAVTGTPTATLVNNAYNVTVTATNGAHTSIRPVTILIEPLPINLSGFVAGKVGSPLSGSLQAVGGSGTYSYVLAPGVVPSPGLALSGATGSTLSGTPAAITTFKSLLVLVTDTTTGRLGYGGIQGAGLPPNLPTLSFQAQIGGGGNSIQFGSVLNSSKFSFGAQGGTLAYSFGDTPHPPAGPQDMIPPGLSTVISGSGANAQGQLSGKPTQTGFFTYWMRVTDSAAPTPNTADLFLDLTVNPYGNGGGGPTPFAVSINRVPDGIHTAASYPATQLFNSYPSGTSPTITWTAVSGLPNGNWSLTPQGVLSANAATVAGTYFIIVNANDGTTTVSGRLKVVIE